MTLDDRAVVIGLFLLLLVVVWATNKRIDAVLTIAKHRRDQDRRLAPPDALATRIAANEAQMTEMHRRYVQQPRRWPTRED